MQWLNEPASWQRNGDVLRVSVDPGTDFWRTTGYGYVHDNGHVYGDVLPGDIDVSVRVRGTFANQYDQAGIMLRADEQTWLKTGLEFFEGRSRLSTVLTLGWSSWMVADLPPDIDEVTLRVSRRGDAVEVRYAAGDGAAELAALVFMPPDREMLAGIVCAAPEGTGFSVAFHDLRIAGRDWGGQGAVDSADWAGEPAASAAGWAPEQAAGTRASWAGDAAGWDEQADDRATGWAGDKPGQAASGWAGDKPDDGAAAWEDKPDDTAAGRGGGDEPGEPAGWAEETSAGVPTGWGDELPADESLDWAKPKASEPLEWAKPQASDSLDRAKPQASDSLDRAKPQASDSLDRAKPQASESLDWAKPQASEPAEDWDRLSLNVSTSWNAFAAAEPAKEPAEEQPDKPGTGQAAAQANQDSEDSTGELPASPADDKTEPSLRAADPPSATAKPGEPDTRGRNGRGRNKAKLPAPRSPVASAPADAADEWISLLTADSVEELAGSAQDLSGPGLNPTRTEPDEE